MVSCCYYFQLVATEKKGVVRAYIAVERERERERRRERE